MTNKEKLVGYQEISLLWISPTPSIGLVVKKYYVM